MPVLITSFISTAAVVDSALLDGYHRRDEQKQLCNRRHPESKQHSFVASTTSKMCSFKTIYSLLFYSATERNIRGVLWISPHDSSDRLQPPDNSELDKWQKMDAVLFVIESTKCQPKICVILLSFSQVFMQDV